MLEIWLATPISLDHRRIFIDIFTVSNYPILPSIAGGLGFTFSHAAEKGKNSAQAGLQKVFVILRHTALREIEDLAAYVAMSSVSCSNPRCMTE